MMVQNWPYQGVHEIPRLGDAKNLLNVLQSAMLDLNSFFEYRIKNNE